MAVTGAHPHDRPHPHPHPHPRASTGRPSTSQPPASGNSPSPFADPFGPDPDPSPFGSDPRSRRSLAAFLDTERASSVRQLLADLLELEDLAHGWTHPRLADWLDFEHGVELDPMDYVDLLAHLVGDRESHERLLADAWRVRDALEGRVRPLEESDCTDAVLEVLQLPHDAGHPCVGVLRVTDGDAPSASRLSFHLTEEAAHALVRHLRKLLVAREWARREAAPLAWHRARPAHRPAKPVTDVETGGRV